MIAALLVCCGIVYNLLATAGAVRFRRRGAAVPEFCPPVSILKPVRGRDERFYESILSHVTQDYPAPFELIFGVADPEDAAREDIERLRREFPGIPIRTIFTSNDAPNQKVGSLEKLAAEAKHEFLLVNDGDIQVPQGYLRRVMERLSDPTTGMVTCLYRGRGQSVAAKAEAIGIVTEFAPSVLVARLLNAGAFALGSTMAFRRADLAAIGGFAAIREYIADDYQLGARIGALGKRIEMPNVVVETNLGSGGWAAVWNHQVRWSRTIRISRPAGYFGYAVTQATFWCLAAAIAGYPVLALAGLGVRLCAAAFAMRALGARILPELIAVPLRDVFGVAVWCAGLFGSTVDWRGVRYRLQPDGRMTRA